MKSYDITFSLIKESDKSIYVRKKTKKIDKNFCILKSIIIKIGEVYEQEKSLWKDVKYQRKRICLTLPEWYVKNELGFYA